MILDKGKFDCWSGNTEAFKNWCVRKDCRECFLWLKLRHELLSLTCQYKDWKVKSGSFLFLIEEESDGLS